MTERMGYWVDMTTPYRTMDPAYVQSVWWSLKQVFDKGLLVQDYRVAPYCPRCGTGLSDHELAQGYETVVDPSVYVRFPLTSGPYAGQAALLVWTTTPWTLVSNTAVAVRPDVTYVTAHGRRPRCWSSPSRCFEQALGEGWTGHRPFTGAEMERWTYQRPFELVDWPAGADGHFVVLADYVTTEDGTGLVHQSPAFGAEDLAVCRAYGLPVVRPGPPDGHFEESVRLVGGEFFKHADKSAGAGPRGARVAVPAPGLRARLPALLALPHRAALLRAAVLVHPDHPGQGRAARRERADQLVPGQHQVGPLRRLAAQQHRLGAVPVAGTGARRCRSGGREADPAHLVCVGSLAELGGLAGQDLSGTRPAPAVRRRRHAALHRVRSDGGPGHDAAGARGHRRLVRLRLDAVRPVGLPARGGLAGAVRRRRSPRSSSARRSTRPAAGSTR